MSQKNPDTLEGTDSTCPTCGRSDFKSLRGVKQHHSRAHGEKLEPTKVKKVCAECGDEFEVYPYRDDAEYCSRECAYGNRDMPSTKRVTVECDWCGESFETYKSLAERRSGRNYCDYSCYGKWRSENIVGESHPQWSSGDRNYGNGWTERKRRKVRERDGFKCQRCGMDQKEHEEEYGSRLSVHHMRRARDFDSDKERNDMDNLITLCRHCHHRWEGIPLKPDNRQL